MCAERQLLLVVLLKRARAGGGWEEGGVKQKNMGRPKGETRTLFLRGVEFFFWGGVSPFFARYLDYMAKNAHPYDFLVVVRSNFHAISSPQFTWLTLEGEQHIES